MAHIRRVDGSIHINLPGACVNIADGYSLQCQVTDPEGQTHTAIIKDGVYTETTQTPVIPPGKTED